MNSIATVQPLLRGRLALIVAGVLALLGWSAAPAHAGYYGDPYYGSGGCSYRCGYPVYRRYGCYSCGRRVFYERRYIEREYVERRYGYGGYRCHYGYYSPCGYRRSYGYNSYGGYRPYGYGYGNGYGYGGVGRRWPLPFDGYGPYAGPYAEGPPRPPAPVWDAEE